MSSIHRRPLPISRRSLPISRRSMPISRPTTVSPSALYVPMHSKIALKSLTRFVPKSPLPLNSVQGRYLKSSPIKPRMALITPGNVQTAVQTVQTVQTAVVWIIFRLCPFVLLVYSTYKTLTGMYEEVPSVWKRLDQVRTSGPYQGKKDLLIAIWRAVMTSLKEKESELLIADVKSELINSIKSTEKVTAAVESSELLMTEVKEDLKESAESVRAVTAAVESSVLLLTEVKEELKESAKSVSALTIAVEELKQIIDDIRQNHGKECVCTCVCESCHGVDNTVEDA